jgi:hypothetical protein
MKPELNFFKFLENCLTKKGLIHNVKYLSNYDLLLFIENILLRRKLGEILKTSVSQFSVITFAAMGLCLQKIKILANKICGLKSLKPNGFYVPPALTASNCAF